MNDSRFPSGSRPKSWSVNAGPEPTVEEQAESLQPETTVRFPVAGSTRSKLRMPSTTTISPLGSTWSSPSRMKSGPLPIVLMQLRSVQPEITVRLPLTGSTWISP